MPHSYFQRAPWTSFSHGGTVYPLDHLNEYSFDAMDSGQRMHSIAVTFDDHCFTKAPSGADDPDLEFPGCSRRPGYFCVDRHRQSLGLRQHIEYFSRGEVWNLKSENYAAIPATTQSGQPAFYAVVFSLDPVTGLPVQFHMRIKSAYLVDANIDTFGAVTFAHLLTLRLARKRPNRILDRHRKRPRLRP